MNALISLMNNELITVKKLDETENIKYKLIENIPVIEERIDEVGEYYWDKDTEELKVKYIVQPKLESEVLKERIINLEKSNAELLLLLAKGV